MRNYFEYCLFCHILFRSLDLTSFKRWSHNFRKFHAAFPRMFPQPRNSATVRQRSTVSRSGKCEWSSWKTDLRIFLQLLWEHHQLYFCPQLWPSGLRISRRELPLLPCYYWGIWGLLTCFDGLTCHATATTRLDGPMPLWPVNPRNPAESRVLSKSRPPARIVHLTIRRVQSFTAGALSNLRLHADWHQTQCCWAALKEMFVEMNVLLLQKEQEKHHKRSTNDSSAKSSSGTLSLTEIKSVIFLDVPVLK